MKDIGERLKSYEPLWDNWYKDGTDSYIGGGNFGKVYRFRQKDSGRLSAVKVIPILLAQTIAMNHKNKQSIVDAKKKLVMQEIKNMQKLFGKRYLVQCINHSIKDIYDDKNNAVGFDVLIQMDYYTPLSDHMKENGELNVGEARRLAVQICSALRSMHSINMLHRDVKIENIFLDSAGDFLLGDFGVSKQVETSDYSSLAGTQPFIAPEVWNVKNTNKRYTKTADIYSFGVTLYYLLNRNMLPLVREDSTQNEIDDAIESRLGGKSFPDPENGSEKFKAIVMKCCEYRAENRYQSADALLQDLETLDYEETLYNENAGKGLHLVIKPDDADELKEKEKQKSGQAGQLIINFGKSDADMPADDRANIRPDKAMNSGFSPEFKPHDSKAGGPENLILSKRSDKGDVAALKDIYATVYADGSDINAIGETKPSGAPAVSSPVYPPPNPELNLTRKSRKKRRK